MRRVALAAVGALVTLVTACSGSGGDLGSVTLRVGDQAGIQQALLRGAGTLDGTPYRVDWAEFPAAAPLLEALRGGAIDVGIAGDAPTLNALAATKDISIAAASIQPKRGGLAILVPRDSPIKTVADLRGRTISPTTQGSIGHYLLLQALAEAGLPARDVKISFLQPVDAAAALNSGAIDAWSTWDPYTAVAERERGARILRDAGGLASGLTFLDANNDSLADPAKRAAMADFVRRYNRALDWAHTSTADYTRIYLELTRRPEPVADLVAERAKRTGTPITPEIVAELQRTADNFHRYGVLRERVVVADRVQDLATAPPP